MYCQHFAVVLNTVKQMYHHILLSESLSIHILKNIILDQNNCTQTYLTTGTHVMFSLISQTFSLISQTLFIQCATNIKKVIKYTLNFLNSVLKSNLRPHNDAMFPPTFDYNKLISKKFVTYLSFSVLKSRKYIIKTTLDCASFQSEHS